jgi:hypothetical protein
LVASLRSTIFRVVLIWSSLFVFESASIEAQSSQTVQEWTVQNLRASWCVHFLMDSTVADKVMPREFRPVRATDFPDVSIAVRNVMKSDSTYRNWVPAEFCAVHFDQVTVGDQILGAPSPELDKAQFLGTWLIGGVPSNAPAEPVTSPTFFVATMRTANWRLIRLAETSLIPVEYAEPSIGKVPESAEDRFRITMGKTVITWDGHLAGDSAWAAPRTEQTWWALSSRGARLYARVGFQPEKTQNIVGALQIAGNDDLAKSLRASPIRMVGPLSWGGSGSIAFSR